MNANPYPRKWNNTGLVNMLLQSINQSITQLENFKINIIKKNGPLIKILLDISFLPEAREKREFQRRRVY